MRAIAALTALPLLAAHGIPRVALDLDPSGYRRVSLALPDWGLRLQPRPCSSFTCLRRIWSQVVGFGKALTKALH